MHQNGDKRGRILIADGDEIFRYSTAALLSREHYTCECAPDASSALVLLREAAYDLLIADIEMPGNLNLELIRDLAAQDAHIPVALVTENPSLPSALASFQLPVVAYLVKPFAHNELFALVDKVMAPARLMARIRILSERLQEWQQDLGHVAQVAMQASHNPSIPIQNALQTLTLHHIAGCLADLRSCAVSPPGLCSCSDTELVPCQPGVERTNLPNDSVEPLPLRRVKQLEETLRKIANDLTVAGITTDLTPASVPPEVLEELPDLSAREWEILRSLLAGQRVPTIARTFFLSPHTVRNHLKSIFRKLGVCSQTELLERFRQSPPKPSCGRAEPAWKDI